MFLLQRKYRPLLGLDITTSSVKLIELAMAGGQYRVEAYAAEPTPQNAINEKAIVDADAVGEAVRRAVKRAGAKSTEVAVAKSTDGRVLIDGRTCIDGEAARAAGFAYEGIGR